MFYAQFVLSKKGPLSKIWLAAHWDRKLTKAQIFETNVQDAVDEILKPKVKLSLRTTGHLLLGIVRIYSRKAKYVLEDCNEAYVRIRRVFQFNNVDVDLRDRKERELDGEEHEMINNYYDVLTDINDFQLGNIGNVPANQSRIDDITLRDDNFETSSQRNLAFDGELGLDDFGEREQQNFSNMALDDFGDGGLGPRELDFSGLEEGRRDASDRHSFPQAEHSHAAAGGITLAEDDEPTRAKHAGDAFGGDDFGDFGAATDLDMLFDDNELDLAQAGALQPGGDAMEVDQVVPQNGGDIFGTQESFTLEPLDAAALQQQAQEKVVRQRRKRRLVVDEYKNIKGDEMKANMSNYTDTMQPLDLAPPTKMLMRLKENGTAEKLFSMPGCTDAILDPGILRLYQSHLVLLAREEDVEDLSAEIRREMDLADNLEDDLYSHLDDDLASNSHLFQFGDQEVDENQEPFDASLNNGIGGAKTPQVDASLVEEKRVSTRRLRAQEKEDEEEEDDEEEVFTRRTKTILNSIAQKLRASENNQIYFHDILTRGTRRTAAQKFYALLELHKRHAICVEQSEPFGPIEIRAGQSLDETLAMTPQ